MTAAVTTAPVDRFMALRKAAYLFGGFGVRILATLALIPLLGRTLGPAGFGVFTVANTVTLVIWQAVEFGIPLVASRRFAKSSSADERNAALTIATFARLTLVPIALLIGLAMVANSPLLKGQYGIAMLACLLGVQSGMNFGWMLTALGASKIQSILETSPAVLTLFLCMLFVRDAQDVVVVFAIMNVAAFLANLAAWNYARRHAQHRKPARTEITHALLAGRPVFLYRVALIGTTSCSAYILGYFAAGHEVGNYALADRLLSAAVGLLQPLSVLAFPQSMKMFAEKPLEGAKVYARFTAKVVAATSVAVLATLTLGPWLIPLAMGPKYLESIPYLMTLIWALPFMALSQMIVSCILYPLHRDFEIGMVYAIAFVLLVAMSALTLPQRGAAGMAPIRLVVEALVALCMLGLAYWSVKKAAVATA